MKAGKQLLAALCGVAVSAFAGIDVAPIDASADRVRSPLKVDMERIGTIRPRSIAEIRGSNWMIGCETLDRDYANFDEYKEYLAPLGIRTMRLQAGWAKCEKEKGRYDFSWLDHVIDYARAQGMNVLLETGYGNPIYEGGGGANLAGGFPTSDEALAAWDAWVEALSRHFSDRVRDWAMWNEPDNGKPEKTPESIAAFNVRTARIIKKVIPDARIAGLSLARNDPERLEKCLKAMGDGVKLFDWIIYHGYAPAPESSYANVEKQKVVLAKYNPAAKMRQGENGCPSEMSTRFALSNIAWSEYSQAKWNMRRMLGDLGHDVESGVFTICDYNHRARGLINLKGLLRANANMEVIAVKRAYYAVQNVAAVFDDTLSRVKDSTFGTKDVSITTWEYRKGSGDRLFVFWAHGRDFVRVGGEDGVMGPGDWRLPYERPGDSFETRPAMFNCSGAPLEDPVWVDLFTGRVYAFPKRDVLVHSCGITFVNVPVYDSPCILTEKKVVLP